MSKEIDVVILAGGYGKRMGEQGLNRQKCMTPFLEKPVVEHILENATSAFGSFRPILAVSYRADDVIGYFGRYWRHNEILYRKDVGGVEDKGVLQGLKDELSKGPFLVIHGDIIFDSELLLKLTESQERFHPLAIVSASSQLNVSNHHVVKLQDHRITDIIFPAPSSIPKSYMRNMGVTAYDARVFKEIIEKFPPEKIAYMAQLFSELLPQETIDIFGVEYIGDWLHFETPKDFKQVKNV